MTSKTGLVIFINFTFVLFSCSSKNASVSPPSNLTEYSNPSVPESQREYPRPVQSEFPTPPVGVIDLTSPDNNAIIYAKEVTFRWKHAANAQKYEIQITKFGKIATYEIKRINSFSYKELPQDGSIIKWRVRGIGDRSEGRWSTNYSFKSEPNPPAPVGVVDLTSPGNNAIIYAKEVMFRWKHAANAQKYEIQITKFGKITTYEIKRINSFSYKELPQDGSIIKWRVRGIGDRTEGRWSTNYSFKSEPNPPPPVGAVDLTSPGNDAIIYEKEVTLRWKHAVNAQKYEIQITKFGKTATYEIKRINSFSYKELPQDGSIIKWRVRGIGDRTEGRWSTNYSFKSLGVPRKPPGTPPQANEPKKKGTEEKPKPPSKPPNAKVELMKPLYIKDKIEFKWDCIGETDKCDLEIAKNNDFSSVFKSYSTTPKTLFILKDKDVKDFPLDTKLYWHVRCCWKDQCGPWYGENMFVRKKRIPLNEQGK